MSEQDEEPEPTVEPHLAAVVVDVFVYVVVLNLFVEYLPVVISETFTLSLLTAVLLKGVLEVVVAAKKRVVTRFRQAATPTGKVVAAFLVWAVVFGSKFLVLFGHPTNVSVNAAGRHSHAGFVRACRCPVRARGRCPGQARTPTARPTRAAPGSPGPAPGRPV